MDLTISTKKNILRNLIMGRDYRGDIVKIIDDIFLNYCIEFFKRVISAKLIDTDITADWYKKEFLNPDLDKREIAINSGLNIKTISNIYNTSKKEVVIEASEENYERLYNVIEELVKNDEQLDIKLTIKFKDVSVDLTINESLIVINTLAVKRAEIRGGAWSTVGKQIEKPLMITLCKLYNVKHEYIDQTDNPESFREVDFYILSADSKKLRCEVKLMGKGNPESADAIFAREPDIFIADKMSDKNKTQSDKLGVRWVELRAEKGYARFANVLSELNVPYEDIKIDLSKKIAGVFSEIFS